MKNHDAMRQIIAGFSGKEQLVTFPRIYQELTGDMHTAALLNQIVFWSDKTRRKDGFFYKSYAEWEEELLLTEYQVRRSTKVLKDLGLVETKLQRANGSPTLHYKLNFSNLSESILNKLKNRNQTNLRNETEETSESLTDDYTDEYKHICIPKEESTLKDSSKKKEVKHQYGEFKNVLLTNEEYQKLQERFPNDLQQRIERVSDYVASTGKKYKSHYATIISWANKDRVKEKPVLSAKKVDNSWERQMEELRME